MAFIGPRLPLGRKLQLRRTARIKSRGSSGGRGKRTFRHRIIVSRRPSTRSSSSSGGSASVRNKPPEVKTVETDKGTEVNVNTNDEILKELALQRVQKEKQLEQEKQLRAARRASAEQTAGLQRRALETQIEQRGVNLEREKSKLKRATRVRRAEILSRSAQANVTNTSAFKASRIAAASNLKRETGELDADEARNKILDNIRREEIEANLQARIAENPDPINVFLGQGTQTTPTTGATNEDVRKAFEAQNLQFRNTPAYSSPNVRL